MEIENLLLEELKRSVDFFLNYTNLDKNSGGFGLTVDSTKRSQVASIASVGFALSAWVIASERGFISRTEAQENSRRTLHTLLSNVSHYKGFFAHFLNMANGERHLKCEFSTIDTALCLNGVITAAAYFNDPEISECAQALLERVDWQFIVFEKDDTTLFRMAYNPDIKGDYVGRKPGFISQWDMAAEQKMMYLQAGGCLDPGLASKLYHGFRRDMGEFEGQDIIINPGGNLFAYQFSEAWFDSAGYLDPDGMDWFNNTRLAALANRSFCIENASAHKTYHANSWGLSAGDSPRGYAVFGSTPSLYTPDHDGTVCISAALACLPFIPEYTKDLVDYVYHNHSQTWGQYGFYDAYNLDVDPNWYSRAIYGINKGCSMIMIENHLSGLIWNAYTNSSTIQNSLKKLSFMKR